MSPYRFTYTTGRAACGRDVHTVIVTHDDDRGRAFPGLLCGTGTRYRFTVGVDMPEAEARAAATCAKCVERNARKS